MDYLNDIYFQDKYGKLYEKYDHGENSIFLLESEFGTVKHMFIKRVIPGVTIDNLPCFDIRTPYGYGGPIIVETTDRVQLIRLFEKKFGEYCENNNIVSEFIRFHPIQKNAIDFSSIYNIEFNRKTVGTKINNCQDVYNEEFSKGCRKNIRRAINKGVSYIINERPKSLDNFMRVYCETMDRNSALDYYYFDKEYFNNILKFFGNNLLEIQAVYENEIIAAGLYFVSDKLAHVHLSGTKKEFLHLSPAYILRYALTEWCITHDIDYIHHGGGRTSADDDTLYLFKKQFGQNTSFDFYIAEKIWNKKIYNDVCRLKRENENINDYIQRYFKEGKANE